MGSGDRSVWRLRSIVFIFVFLFLVSEQVQARPQARTPTARGTITTVAGTDKADNSGCGDLTADRAGNVYFVDGADIRKIAAATGAITTLPVPPGLFGGGIAVDSTGNIYIAHLTFELVRKVAAGTGAVSIVAGTEQNYNGLSRRIPGPATQAFLRSPRTLALDAAGNLYIGEFGDIPTDILKVTAATGAIAGVPLNLNRAVSPNGGNQTDTIPAMNQGVTPAGMLLDGDGSLYIADSNHSVVWKVAAGTGTLTRLGGTGFQGYSGDGVRATDAKLNGPDSLAFDAGGNLYISDSGNSRIRMVGKSDGIITTVAGNGTGSYQKSGDGDGGPATQAMISYPTAIAFNPSGDLYICAGRLRKVAGVASTSALSGAASGSRGATAARPLSVPGTITTVAGNGTRNYGGDGLPATDMGLPNPVNVSVDRLGNVYITDLNMHSILQVAAGTGLISRVAGTGKGASSLQSGDGGPATAATLFGPADATPDASGDLYIADTDGAIRKVVQAGTITSLIRAQNSAQSRFAFSRDAVPLVSRGPRSIPRASRSMSRQTSISPILTTNVSVNLPAMERSPPRRAAATKAQAAAALPATVGPPRPRSSRDRPASRSTLRAISTSRIPAISGFARSPRRPEPSAPLRGTAARVSRAMAGRQPRRSWMTLSA
jgi:trimeric autotransporter adhesin